MSNNTIIPRKEVGSCKNNGEGLQHHIKIEQKIIHLMLTHPHAIDEMIASGVTSERFDPTHHALVNSIFAEFESSGRKRILTRNNYRQKLLRCHGKNGKKGDAILDLSLWDKCRLAYRVDPNDLGLLKEQLRDTYFARKTHFFLQDFRSNISKGGYERAGQILCDDLHDAIALLDQSPRQDERVRVSSHKNAFLEWLREPSDAAIRAGFREIDARIPGGFNAGQLTIFVAPSGNHKTNLMINLARNIATANHQVWYCNLEDVPNHVIARLVAREANLPVSRIIEKTLSREELENISKNWPPDIQLFSPCSAITTHRIEYDIKSADQKPAVVFIDYQNCLAPLTQRAQRNDLEIGETLKDLRRLGRKYGFAVITAAQLGRDAIKRWRRETDSSADTADVLGSQQYGADADCIFGLRYDDEDENKLKVWTIKARYGSRALFEMYVDPKTCLIAANKACLITRERDDESW